MNSPGIVYQVKMQQSATAIAHPNIALIKYWGNRDPHLRIPLNGSISMNLGGLESRTTVTFNPALPSDELFLAGRPSGGPPLERVRLFLDRIRHLAGLATWARVESANNFPTGAGIASSASAFAALSLAASTAAGLHLSEIELSRLARTGSGSACRSIPGGFVEWLPGEDDASSFAVSIAPPEYWDLVDCIAVTSLAHKHTGSTEGHRLASTSPLQAARLADAPRRLVACREALCGRDFSTLAEVVEQDSNLMHAVMMTSTPPLLYWEPATLAVMQAVTGWRAKGWPVLYTIDAGPNVHILCLPEVASKVSQRLTILPGVKHVYTTHPGGSVQIISSHC